MQSTVYIEGQCRGSTREAGLIEGCIVKRPADARKEKMGNCENGLINEESRMG